MFLFRPRFPDSTADHDPKEADFRRARPVVVEDYVLLGRGR
jgi:hypothetical protein